MDIYSQKSRWKLYLAIAGAIIVIVSVVYTNYLTGQLAQEERRKTDIFGQVQVELNEIDDEDRENCNYDIHLEILRSNKTIPVIIVNDRGGIDGAKNFGDDLDVDEEFLKKEVERMRQEGFEPIEGFAYSVYFKESTILRQLRYFPLVQLLLIAAFVLFGYMGFNSARRAEQNRVWVGMAKETAHQLGTPISAILAWIEHLKDIRAKDGEVAEVLHELQNDVSRLELIADRFSKIGSEPKLEAINVYEELEKCRAYMERRAPRKVKFHFPDTEHIPLHAAINPPLFDWVIENLLRNALDAMEGRGEISATVSSDKSNVHIDIRDTGKGIAPSKFKTVFQPGFTTKKRGWGLGLSLAKRIIQEYHSGKIFVKDSVIGEGTTFRITLPKTSEA
ncbi:MAG: HAMP domain-containing histidine kinase [Saprospiraceae bacterium]|nr:HAMP domain-containing histidine kinase [Saprospiraceae bacterium]